MSLEENKRLTRRMLDELLNKGNLAIIDELGATEITLHSFTQTRPIVGKEKLRAFFQRLRRGFPDFTVEIEDLVAEGDRVAVRWTSHQTFSGPYLGVAPTGRSARVSGFELFRFADGQCVEIWVLMDALGVMQQVGVIPQLDRLPAPMRWLAGLLQRLPRPLDAGGRYDL